MGAVQKPTVRQRGTRSVSEFNGNGNGWAQRYSIIIQTITVVGLVVGGLWAGIIAPMGGRINELERETVTEREARDLKDDINRRIEENRAAIEKVKDQEVPRAEHEEHWKEESDRLVALHDNFADLDKQFQSIFTGGDAIKNLQKQLDDLRLQVHADGVNGK
jgi:hypothetical protein